jgi:exodeoxyribonuclease-5
MTTKHQDEAIEKIIALLEQGYRTILLKGSAGVGKTFTVNQLIRRIPKRLYSGSVCCSAPTHKALSVLMDKIDEKVEFDTTHAALKYKMQITKNGDKVFKPKFSDEAPLERVGLFIVDEASMIGKRMYDDIEYFSDQANTIVIYIGDEKQINPVKEDDSIVFKTGMPAVELTEIIRQGKGNPIIDLSRNLHLVNLKQNNLIEEEVGIIYSANTEKVVSELAKANGTDSIKYLAWTNKEVDQMNKLVRRRIYDNPKKLELGESIIFNSPYGTNYYTNQELRIESLDIIQKTFKLTLAEKGTILSTNTQSEVTLKLYVINNKLNPVYVVHEDSESNYNQALKKLKASAIQKLISWKDYYDFMTSFADFKYNHALTIHKSQGSSFQKAVVNVEDISLNRNLIEKKRLLYTAITRASNLLIIYSNGNTKSFN